MAASEPSRVVVLGAGPVGLGACLELARFGIRSVLIEKRETTSWHPKTRNFNTRTMEIARGWGPLVYRRLRSIDTPPGWKSPIRFLSTAVGKEFGKIDSKGFEGPGPDVSPCEPIMSSQELIEEILLDAVRATGLVDVRFSVEATRLIRGGSADDSDVALEVVDLRSGVKSIVAGAALVAADGASSLVRNELNLALEGPQGLSHIVNCYFKADIEPFIGDRRAVLLFVANEHARGVLQPLDGAGRWLCQITTSEADWSPEVFTRQRVRDWVRAAVGVDTLEPDILSIGFWKLNATVVERLAQGRVVLCGDAAHQFPPTGGLGVNTGLQGMHNAMWKLAACIKGHAAWSLLATYDEERRAVSRRITSQSLQNSVNVGRIANAAASGGDNGMSAEDIVTTSRRYGNHLGVEFGASYASMAVIPDGSTPPVVADDYSDYVQSASPGCRAPHVWLGQSDAHLSILELFGPAFTLVAASKGEAWVNAAHQAAEKTGMRIDSYQVGTAGLNDLGGFANVYGIDDDGAVLVRPDGHVAWRSRTRPEANATLEEVVRHLLGAGERGSDRDVDLGSRPPLGRDE